MSSDPTHKVIHDEAKSRYVIYVADEEAGYADYDSKETIALEMPPVRDFNHTVVYPKFQGQGLSKELVKFALDDTRRIGGRVIASCSAVDGFIASNPQYKELLHEQ